MTKNWPRRHPLLLYCVLAFSISWGGIAIVLAATGFSLATPGQLETGLLFGAMLLGPSFSGLALTIFVDGHAGLGDLWARFLRWKTGVAWYAVAMLTAPLLLLTILLFFGTLAAPAFAPRFQLGLFAVGILAGCFEEIGWTGFATPRLLAGHSLGFTGLSIGLIWAFWHLLVDFRYNIDAMGALWPVAFAIVYLATLTPYRMLMTLVYSKTQSLLLAIIMHASFTGWLMVMFPVTSPVQNLVWQATFAISLWSIVAFSLRWAAARTNPAKIRPEIQAEHPDRAGR